MEILKMLDIKCVVGATPGSGSLGVAAMELGVIYFGICRDVTHFTWLGNVLDRAALTYVCEAGTHLYQEDLATSIKELFSDIMNSEEDQATDEVIAMSEDEN